MRNLIYSGLLLAVPFAFGSPVTYDINFTVSGPVQSGLPVIATAPVGSFTYDQATQSFSSFVISWNGTAADLTNAANLYAPSASPCNSASGGAGAFAMMSQALSGCDTYGWTLTQQSIMGVSIFASGPGSTGSGFGAPGTPATNIGLQTGKGTYSIAARPSGDGGVGTGIPEPSTMALLAIAGCAGAILRRKW